MKADGFTANTIKSLLVSEKFQREARGSVLVVDEAALVSARLGDEFFHLADKADSKIIKAYMDSGRDPEYLKQALSNITPLDEHQIYLLTAGNIEIEKNRKCLEWMKAILKDEKFNAILSEAKGDELEGRKARKTPTARLIYRLMEAVSTPPRSPSSSKNLVAGQRFAAG